MHGMCPAPFPGIMDLIAELRSAGLKIALVTGKGRKSCDISLAYYGIANSFDLVLTGSADGNNKTLNIRETLERFALRPEEAIYVGDSPSDVYSSHQAGVPIVSVLWGSFIEPEKVLEAGPDSIAHSVGELADYLKTAI